MNVKIRIKIKTPGNYRPDLEREPLRFTFNPNTHWTKIKNLMQNLSFNKYSSCYVLPVTSPHPFLRPVADLC